MNPSIESTLFRDPQAERRTAQCPRCGGICYWPGYFCIRCGREEL